MMAMTTVSALAETRVLGHELVGLLRRQPRLAALGGGLELLQAFGVGGGVSHRW